MLWLLTSWSTSRFLRLYETIHCMTNFEYQFKKIQFGQRFRVRRNAALVVNSHRVQNFGMLTCSREDVFVQVPSQRAAYEGSHLPSAPTPMVFAHQFTLALLKERRSVLFRIGVSEDFVYVVLSFFSSAWIGDPVDQAWYFQGTTTLAELGILLALLLGVHAFLAGVGLLSVLQGSLFDYNDTQLSYRRSSEVYWDDETVRWLPHVRLSDDLLDIPARLVTSKKRAVSDIQVKRPVWFVPVKFKPVPRKAHAEALHAVRSVHSSLAGFPDLSDDMLTSENGIFKGNASCDLLDMTSKKNRGHLR